MTRAAITRLSRNGNGFVLLVEGGRIDHAHHYGNAHRALTDTVALSDAVPSYEPYGWTLVASPTLGTDTSTAADRRVRTHLSRLHRADTRSWQLVAVTPVPEALPAMPAPHEFRRPVRLGDGVYVAGDHRDSGSIQGAMVSGRRAAQAVLAELGESQREEPA